MGADTVRIGIAEDSALFRDGLTMQLGRLDVQVLITAGTGDELLAQMARHPIDAAIIDVRMPPNFTDDGLQTAEKLAASHPDTGILMLSQYAELSYATRLFTTGTAHRGYLLKDRVANAEALRDALHRVCQGESVVDDQLIGRLLNHQRHLNKLDDLTPTEQAVLRHMAEGRSNAGIATTMWTSTKAVEAHMTRIFAKLEIPGSPDDNRRVLAVLAWLRGT